MSDANNIEVNLKFAQDNHIYFEARLFRNN